MNRFSRILVVVFGMAALLLVTACGAGPATTPAAGPSPATAAAVRRSVSRVAATIEIERQGILVVDSAASMLYVVSENSVLFIDTAARQVAGKLDLVGRSGSAVLDSAGRVLYVSNRDAGAVSAIDVATRQVTATITVGEEPQELALDAATHTLYVANYGVDQAGGPSVSVIDTKLHQVVSTIAIGVTRTADGGDFNNMGPMFVDPAAHALYVRGGILSVIDTQKRKVVSRIKISDDSGTLLDPAAHALFLRNPGQGISIFDTSTRKIVGSIKAPSRGQLILDPAKHVVYLGDRYGTVSMIDTMAQKVTGSFSVGPPVFWAGVVDPDVNVLYLFQPGKISPEAGGRDTVTVIDTATHQVIGTITVGAEGPLSLEFPLVDGVVDPTTGDVYVECLLANTPAIQILQAG